MLKQICHYKHVNRLYNLLILLLLIQFQGTTVIKAECHSLFNTLPNGSYEESAIIGSIRPVGFIYCAKQCISLSECQYMIYDKATVTCVLDYHNIRCNETNRKFCISRAEIKQIIFDGLEQPGCPSFYRSVLLSSGVSRCISAFSTVLNTVVRLRNLHSSSLLMVEDCTTFVIVVGTPGSYRIKCGSLSGEGIVMTSTFRVTHWADLFPDHEWYIYHNADGRFTFRNVLRQRCLGETDEGVLCSENDSTLLWDIIIV